LDLLLQAFRPPFWAGATSYPPWRWLCVPCHCLPSCRSCWDVRLARSVPPSAPALGLCCWIRALNRVGASG